MLNKLVTIALICVCSGAFAQVDRQKLDEYLEVLAQNNKFMGNVGISKNNELIYNKAVGYRDVEAKLAANTETIYGIGSISKTFTAVLIFKAIEAKKLKLNTMLDQFFPTVPNAGKITIQNLLNHSSGIYSFTDDAAYSTWYTLPATENDLVKRMVKGGSVFEPNSKNAYSNSNYVLLSYILEKIYKRTFSEVLNAYIIKHVNLTNTYFGYANKAVNEAKSYQYEGTWNLEANTNASVPLGAGAIKSNAADLVKFMDALVVGKIISKSSFNQMITFNNRFGCGLFEYNFNGKAGFGHDGSIDGYKSIFGHYAAENLSYAIISNGSNYNLDWVSTTVLNAAFGKSFDVPEFKKVEVSSNDLDPFLGVYVSAGFPLKITISKDEQVLMAQATGQSSFPLEAKDKNVFTFDRAGIELVFRVESKSLILKQGGKEFELKKE